jgi:hypothetical protein
MSDQPRACRITYLDRSGRFRWFNTDEAVRRGDYTTRPGAPVLILYEAPEGSWILVRQYYVGREEATEITVDEALAWLSKHCLDSSEPWPEWYRQLAEQRSIAHTTAGKDALEDEDKMILTVLDRNRGSYLASERVASELRQLCRTDRRLRSLGKNQVSRRLRALADRGLVQRPDGKKLKGGYRITDAGKNALAAAPPPAVGNP